MHPLEHEIQEITEQCQLGNLTEDERNFLENERKQQEETAKMRNDDYQLSYALDVLKGLATLSQN